MPPLDFFSKHDPKEEPIEEHHIVVGGGAIELAFNHTTKTVIMLEQAGASDETLRELESHLKKQGYFLFVTAVSPAAPRPNDLVPGE